MIKNYTKAVLLFSILITILIIGCKRESVLDNPIDPILPPPTTVTLVNDLTQVTASVSGIVLDESNAPIASAVVTSGGATTTTNSNGMFIFQNISLSKENGSVTVVKAGYFKGIRSFKTTAGKNHTVRLQLMQKVLSGTVNAAAGGIINLNGGASIIFPAAAFITSTGAGYTGTVNVYSRWINPTASNLPFIIPGDLRGVDTNGAENILETYGMVGAELEDASGNTLKIATGKKATISFPLPASLQASAPATIQLWHFDDATARWKENGTGIKSGNNYTAQVDKFSFWNVDVGTTNFINLDYTLINAITNSPLVSTNTRIKRVSNGNYGYGITNNAGFVSGLVPKNEALVLEVVSICGVVIYSQNIGPFSVSTSLGNINVTIPSTQYITFIGTLQNCSGTPVSNGYVSLYAPGIGATYAASNATGAFSFTILNCSGSNLSFTYQGTDNITLQQGNVLSGSAVNGIFNMGNISTCAVAQVGDVYAVGTEINSSTYRIPKLWKNGNPTDLSSGMFNDGNANSVFVSGTDVYVAGMQNINTGATVWKNVIATNLVIAAGSSTAASVFISGTDIYVAGRRTNPTSGISEATVWKNGIAIYLGNGINTSEAKSIFVLGADIYVVGNESTGIGSYQRAVIWKNGVPTYLTVSANIGSASSVFVLGSDVYVTGNDAIGGDGNNIVIKVWKNNVATILASGNFLTSANSVFVNGADVYIAGTQVNGFGTPVATVWKNGIGTPLTTTNSRANSIFILGTDVYVGGNEFNGSSISIAKVWKNGLGTNLTNGTKNAYVTSIFVK